MLLLFLLIFLAGCEYEFHGHYKIDEEKLHKCQNIEDLYREFGAPLRIPYINNVIYYCYDSFNNFSDLKKFNRKGKIIRIEISNSGVIQKIEVINFVNYKSDKLKTDSTVSLNMLTEFSSSTEFLGAKERDDFDANKKNYVITKSNY